MKYFNQLFALLMFVSCATNYQASGLRGGYSEVPYSSDIVKISFKGNGYTSASLVQDYALLRAADYTFNRGYKYFSIISGKGKSVTSYQQVTPGTVQFNSYNDTATYTNPTYENVTKSDQSMVIKLSNEPSSNSINAAELRYTLARSLNVYLENNDRSPKEASFEKTLSENTDEQLADADHWIAKPGRAGASKESLTDELLTKELPSESIPIKSECKNYRSMGEDFKDCSYNIENEINFNLMISKKTGRHTLTILKQKDYDDKNTKYLLKSGNYMHSCIIISSTRPTDSKVVFVSTWDGNVVRNWSDPKCKL